MTLTANASQVTADANQIGTRIALTALEAGIVTLGSPNSIWLGVHLAVRTAEDGTSRLSVTVAGIALIEPTLFITAIITDSVVS